MDNKKYQLDKCRDSSKKKQGSKLDKDKMTLTNKDPYFLN
jgi:hypothetical protein